MCVICIIVVQIQPYMYSHVHVHAHRDCANCLKGNTLGIPPPLSPSDSHEIYCAICPWHEMCLVIASKLHSIAYTLYNVHSTLYIQPIDKRCFEFSIIYDSQLIH